MKSIYWILLLAVVLAACKNASHETETTGEEHEYIVAAYVWPSCHNEKMVEEYLWTEGIGEWEMIKKATPHFEGHYQPRVPLWGYHLDNDPKAWQVKIDCDQCLERMGRRELFGTRYEEWLWLFESS